MYVVVVLPFVPVMPQIDISLSGWDANAAEASARNLLVSHTSTMVQESLQISLSSSGVLPVLLLSMRTAEAPLSTAWLMKPCPSDVNPIIATKRLPDCIFLESYSTEVMLQETEPDITRYSSLPNISDNNIADSSIIKHHLIIK